MKKKLVLSLALAVSACPLTVFAQEPGAGGQGRNAPPRLVQSDKFRIGYVRIGPGSEGLLFDPATPGPNARVALVHTHPNGDTFNMMAPPEMAARGYRVLTINYHGSESDEAGLAQAVSRGIGFLRTLAGVQKVVIVGHSGGGHFVAWYQNVAEHGSAACQGPEKIYPCAGDRLKGLARPDGIVMLDSTLGAFHQMSAVDPAAGEGGKRDPALDMFIAANGYDPAAKSGKYSAEFAKKFYAAQSARNKEVVDAALLRLQALDAGKGQFSDDEPLVIRGMGVGASGARLYQPDPTYAGHTKKPHTLLKADGSKPEVIVTSVRPPSGQQAFGALNTLRVMTQNTTVRDFLAHSAVRTGPDYAITQDDIVGVDWKSASTATPANAEGITVPALIMPNTCHYLLVPDEIIFDHLGSKDKTFAAVEGAVHGFTPCKPEYGDTVKRAFDYVDGWLGKPGRF
jgi:pimeloyl-ACP methyl ester carboxylesterase